jgi:methylated-DNA-[protein]-cysteine S-methyltransferase
MKVSPELDRRFRDAAAEAGLLDVAYDMVDTPIGDLFVATTDAGLCRISYDPEPERVVENLARTVGARVLRSARTLWTRPAAARRVLREAADRIRARRRPSPRGRVLAPRARRARRVPYGEVTTYGELAKRAEHPRAAARRRHGHEP